MLTGLVVCDGNKPLRLHVELFVPGGNRSLGLKAEFVFPDDNRPLTILCSSRLPGIQAQMVVTDGYRLAREPDGHGI